MAIFDESDAAFTIHAPLFDKTSLISWWDLEEESGTRNDAHGTNHLTDNNTVGYAAGIKGNAASFIHANVESLSIADNASLSMGVGIYFTLGCWVWFNSIDSLEMFMGKYAGGVEREYLLYRVGTSIQFNVSDGVAHNNIECSSPGISAGVWLFVVAWYDGANINIQVNNGTIYSTVFTWDVGDSIATFYLGSYADSSTLSLDGKMDSSFLFKRVLTADERTWLYNSGAGRQYSDLG